MDRGRLFRGWIGRGDGVVLVLPHDRGSIGNKNPGRSAGETAARGAVLMTLVCQDRGMLL